MYIFLVIPIILFISFIYCIKKFDDIVLKIDKIKFRHKFYQDFCSYKESNKWYTIPDNLNVRSKIVELKDLGIIGEASFLHKIQLPLSKHGREKLSNALSFKKIDLNRIKSTHSSIKAISNKITNRVKLFYEIKELNQSESNQEAFIVWLKKNKSHRSFLPFKVLAVIFMINISISVYYENIFPIILQFFIHLILVNVYAQKNWISLYEEALDKEGDFLAYERIVNVLTKHYSQPLKSVDKDNFITTNQKKLRKAIKDFHKLTEKLSVVYSGMGYAILNSIMFWDCWYLPKLLKWKKEQSVLFPKFLSILAEIEYLELFAHYHYIFPNTTFPEFVEKGIIAENIGHPILNEDQLVRNDINFNQKELILVTGSNMAGKTTFLRTIGINLFMAYLGSPVNAKSFKNSNF